MAVKVTAPLLQWNIGSPVNSIAISYDSSRVASGSDDELVRVWDVQTGALVLDPMEGHSGWVRSVAWSTDDTLIVSSSNDNTIRIWDANTGAAIGDPLRGHASSVFAVAFSPDSTWIVSGSEDKTIQIWDVRTGAPIGEPLTGHTAPVFSVALSTNNTRIVSGSEDNTIRIWDAHSGAPIGEPLQGHTDEVRSVAFSHDSTRIVSGSSDATIRLWDACTGAPVGEPLRGHTYSVLSVAFSPDSTYIVSGSSEATIRLWDAHTGAMIGELLRRTTYPVYSVAFSTDCSRIVSGSTDRSICVWKTPLPMTSTDIVASDISTPLFDSVADENKIQLSNLSTDATQDEPSFEMVNSKMTIQEMISCLVKHGCSDLTSSVDTSRSSEVIASGGFGDVRRLVMNNGAIVAIKTLRLHVLMKDDNKAIKRAIREVYIWSRLRHVNVQELLGVVVLKGRLGMVSPWMERGNLKQYIAACPDVQRYQLCVQLTSGVVYLHGIDMVHGDLKATNVLVSQEGTLKINDFDYAILSSGTLQFSTTTRPGGGTLRWMAPELFQPEDEDEIDDEGVEAQPLAARNMETDVYALGMTMLEIITGTIPYSEYKTDVGIYRAIDKKIPPRQPKVLSGTNARATQMWELLLKCWNHNPLARPDASSVLVILQNFAI